MAWRRKIRIRQSLRIIGTMRLATACVLLTAAIPTAAQGPVPQFADPGRRAKLAAAFPEIERIFEQYQKDRRIPGLVFGVVIDGQLALIKTYGVRDRDSKDPVTAGTAFRIASMTKSFTSLAILKLRDEGKLSLEDPVSKYIPELASWKYPTADTVPLRVRQLLTHGAGFPEDNPWGDQQLGEPEAEMTKWLAKGLPFSTAPDTEYEYSNYGFAMLGRIVTAASGRPYREYLETEILKPLGMTGSTLEPAALPASRRAVGYRLTGDVYSVEPSLPHGAFGAMGGLVTTANDMAKYIAFQLSAWPPSDDAEAGPVKRSSVREMQHPWRPSSFFAGRGNDGTYRAVSGAYGYGLAVSRDCRFNRIIGHGGGLPGFGSYMMWLPEEGVGLFAMANLTYQGPRIPQDQALDALRQTGALQPRQVPPAPVLNSTADALTAIFKKWDDGALRKIAAGNLLEDHPMATRRKEAEDLRKQVGSCSGREAVQAENWLRGRFRIRCEKGTVEASFTLAPTMPPTVQFLRFAEAKEATAAPPAARCTF